MGIISFLYWSCGKAGEGKVLFPGGGFSLYSAPRAGVCQDRRLVFWLHSWYNGKKQSCVPDMSHSVGPQENGSGALPCQRRSHAQGSIFRRGPPDRVREELLTTALKLMSTQGIQHTTVEQVYRSVGISRSFFYAFFPTKEDLIVEALYLAAAPPAGICPQPDGRPVDQLAGRGAAVPGIPAAMAAGMGWRCSAWMSSRCCSSGFRRRASAPSVPGSRRLFEGILESFGIAPEPERVDLFINLSLAVIVLSRRFPRPCRCLCPMPPGSPQPSRSAALWTGWNPCGNSLENSTEKIPFFTEDTEKRCPKRTPFFCCALFPGFSRERQRAE